ncbi:class E sortase [Phytohabitans sp. ZYX-F-186]|uniref:Class E sortase n=1 Tax=Phytohabitans maris TaxID=3071409 RepID=A0ABU0ZVS4_9ACTN|nr:class E sortase [Phytohabitans sp. ZYX-F-186]MDQ7911131.1 class E sortase [Phytohabitans sp. ZYX-F-186]
MTAVVVSDTSDRPTELGSGGVAMPAAAPDGRPSGEPARTEPAPSALRVASTMLLLLSFVVLIFATYIGAFSSLHHARAQYTSYANFRKELAQATAPVGPTRPDDPSKLLAQGTAVAVLSIPRIDLREVVFEGTTGSILQNGPGHLRNTPMPGQSGVSVIMGRATTYGGPFGQLSTLNPGDTFTVTTGQGVSTFRVLGVRRGGDPFPPPVAAGGGRLTLTTADGSPLLPSGVLRVDADLTSPALPTPPMPLTRRDLSTAELALGTDQFAWMQLVLWGQALVAAAVLLAVARLHWGRWQVWTVSVPVLVFFCVGTADQIARLLPNLM